MRDGQWLDNKTYTNFSHKQNEYAIKLSEVPAIRVSWERGGPDCSVSGSACKVEKSEEGEGKESAAPVARNRVLICLRRAALSLAMTTASLSLATSLSPCGLRLTYATSRCR